MDSYSNRFGPPKRTVTVTDIDAAPTTEERIALTKTCLEEENRCSPGHYGYYWAICIPLNLEDIRNMPVDNLMWETMHSSPRRPLCLRLYSLTGLEFNGFIDVKAHCQSIARHDTTYDSHPCINRNEDCYKMHFDVISYDLHPVPGYEYPQELDIFKRKHSKSFEVIYSNRRKTGRLVSCGGFYNYVLPELAATDGLMDYSVLHQLNDWDGPVPNILTIKPLKEIVVRERERPNI